MKKPLTTIFIVVFAQLIRPTATQGETSAAAAQGPRFHPAGMTDQSGRFAFRGFHGVYDLAVTFPSGRELKVRAKIGGDTSEVTLVVDQKAGAVKTVSAPASP
jgi:hypothetical protein